MQHISANINLLIDKPLKNIYNYYITNQILKHCFIRNKLFQSQNIYIIANNLLSID